MTGMREVAAGWIQTVQVQMAGIAWTTSLLHDNDSQFMAHLKQLKYIS